MKARSRSRRYVLLLYQNSMDQIWTASLFLGLLLLAVWFFAGNLLPGLKQEGDAALFTGSMVVLGIAVFALISRKAGYVQAYPDHFRLVTPFLRLKIAYRRIFNMHATQFQVIFSPQKASRSERSTLQPFYGATVVLVDLHSYPLSPRVMRLFLPRHLFTPGKTGLVLLVDDWLGLSQDLDEFNLQWRQAQIQRPTRPLYTPDQY